MTSELSIEEQKRFWSNVDKLYHEDGTESCWLWKGRTNTVGYGMFDYSGTTGFVHRISWFIAGKTIPSGEVLDHECRTRSCVNPKHLRSMTQKKNLSLRIMYGGQKIDEDIIIHKKPLTELQKCINHLKDEFMALACTKYDTGADVEKVLYDMIRLRLQQSQSLFSKEKMHEELIDGYKRKYFWRFDEILSEHSLQNRYLVIRKKLEKDFPKY